MPLSNYYVCTRWVEENLQHQRERALVSERRRKGKGISYCDNHGNPLLILSLFIHSVFGGHEINYWHFCASLDLNVKKEREKQAQKDPQG